MLKEEYMKLFKVTVEYTGYVLSEDEDFAIEVLMQRGDKRPVVVVKHAEEVELEDPIHKGFEGSIPIRDWRLKRQKDLSLEETQRAVHAQKEHKRRKTQKELSPPKQKDLL